MIKQRYRRILWFFAKILLSVIWWDIFLPRIGFRRLSNRTRQNRLRKIAADFRVEAIRLGGVMIKVGQFLSARLDVIPREITAELATLQDEVLPEKFEDIRMVIEQEFDCRLEVLFSDFEPVPLAAASIGQVHCAHLYHPAEPGETNHDTPCVMVKVQRPNIQNIVDTDLSAIKIVGGWIYRYRPIRKRANVPELLQEFSRSLYEEIDYLNEGKNAETFAKNFEGRSDILVPQIIWSHTKKRVITLEDVRGIKISDYAAIEAAGIDRADVAKRLFDTYLQQIFNDRFFHADPHPGNLFVKPILDEAGAIRTWQLVFIDFGMMGTISPALLESLREILISVGTKDSKRIVHAYQKLGILLPGTDLDLLERATGLVFEQFWGKTTPEMMEMRQQEAEEFVHEFGDLLYDMPFQIPQNMILLGRSLSILSGMCTGLDASFNVWNGIAPYAAKLVQSEQGSTVQFWLTELGSIVQTAITLPKKTETLFAHIEQGKLQIRNPEEKEQLTRINRSINRLGGSIILAALVLSATQFYLAGITTLPIILTGAALVVFGWSILKR